MSRCFYLTNTEGELIMNINLIKKSTAFIVIFLLFLVLSSVVVTGAGAYDGAPAAGIVSTSSGSLNVRGSAGLNGAVIGKLQKGTYVTLVEKEAGGWWKIEYAPGKYGYVSGSYITAVSGSYTANVNVSKGNLNVRAGAGTSYPVIGSLPGGSKAVVLSSSGGWSRVVFDGTRTGYVSSQYLSTSEKMRWPVPASGRINQYFAAGRHLGLDIGALNRGVPGDAVISATSGKVVYSGWLSGYGYVVYINSTYNGQPVQLRYAHLREQSYLEPGYSVNAGQWIGAMGNTGTSSGVHLHFEVRMRNSYADCLANADSTPVDPIKFF